MKIAIRDLNSLIKYYENQMEEQLKFFNTETYAKSLQSGSDITFVIRHTEEIYGKVIDELKQAIAILENVCPECQGRGYIEYETGVTDGVYKEIAKDICSCQEVK